MLPLVAKGQSIGLVELFSKNAVRWDAQRLELARTMANEAAIALENARLYEDARKLADRDPLTGFYNHRFLHERMGEEVVRSQRGRRPLSVLMLDLDDFKLVNDTFGHLFGDRVLTWAAEVIRSTLRLSDIAARYGGDEFALILPDTDADEARRAAERILEAFRERPFVGEQRGPVPIAASIGVATFPADGRTGTELIAAADAPSTRSSAVAGTTRPPRARRIQARVPPPRTEVPPRTAIRTTSRYWTRRPRTAILYFRGDPTNPAACSSRRSVGSTDPPVLVALLRRLPPDRPCRDRARLRAPTRVPSIGSSWWPSSWPASRALLHVSAVQGLDARSRSEADSFARILSGLSRSVSPDAIVDAIVEELGEATRADHIVVVRRRRGTSVLEARLVSSHPGVPHHTTLLPAGDLDDPVDGGRPPRPAEAVERIARRVRAVYGLTHALAEPLTAGDEVVGAIVLSRRIGGRWTDATRRLLSAAAAEASAALARAYSHRAAEAQASTDALTGLPNRRYFEEFVSLLAKRRRAGDAVGILMVDIDKFKVLNDTHGHATGDEVLRAVASAIVSAVREDDVPARFGGEEFVVLLRNPDPGVAIEVGERIRAAVRGLDLGRFGVAGGQRVGRRRRRRRTGRADRGPHRDGRPGPVPGEARGSRPGRRRLTDYHRVRDRRPGPRIGPRPRRRRP